MKLPNSYGSVYKMTGKRRYPYRAMVTVGWTLDESTGNWKQKRKSIGYYETKAKAMEALAEYNKSPYDPETSKTTLQEAYERWYDEHSPEISESNAKGYRAAYKLCEPIAHKRIVDITLDDLQYIVDNSGKNTPTLRKFKVLMGLIYKWAVIHDIIPPERNKVQYLNIKKAGNPNAIDREPFSNKEIDRLWQVSTANEYYTVILMLIYSGVRISELLELKKADVNLSERWFDVTASKTDAGIRRVPINKKVLKYFQKWYDKNDCEYLISTPEGEHFKYRNYYDSYWKPLIEQISMTHRPHDTRHPYVKHTTKKFATFFENFRATA